MNTLRQNCSRCGTPLRPGETSCIRCGPVGSAPRPPQLGQCSSCRAYFPMGSSFCPSCGQRSQIGRPPNRTERNQRAVSIDSTTLIFQVISVVSSILFTVYFHSLGVEPAWNAYAVALVPTILVFTPQIIGALAFGGRTDDARLTLIACVSGLFIGLRSVSFFLLDSRIPDDGTLAGAMFAGLAGFGVVATTYPRNKSLHEWIADDWKNIRIIWGLIAAYFLYQTRSELFGEFMIFTAGSIAGGSSTEVIQVALLIAVPFLVAPLRQSVAFTIGAFSLASWGGNMIMNTATDQLAWRPNPVITLCCVFLTVPWDEFFSSEQTTF